MGAELAVKYPEYRETIIEYLCTRRVTHWEIDVRASASKALSVITRDGACLDLFMHHVPQLLRDADCATNDYKSHGSVLSLAYTFKQFMTKQPELMKPIESIIGVLIESRHFRNPDLMSHIIRPSILMLLVAYAARATKLQMGTDAFSAWLTIIQSSLLKMGIMIENRKQQNLKALCQQITPAMTLLITVIPLKDQRVACRKLVDLIKSSQTSVLENARICACYILKSYTCVDKHTALELLAVSIEGANENFTMKSVNSRAFFVELRAEIVLYVVHLFLTTDEMKGDNDLLLQIIGAITTCLEDYTRNQKGDIGSILRIAAMQAIQQMGQFLPSIPSDMYIRLLAKLLQQGGEKILRIREEAGRTLTVCREFPPVGMDEFTQISKVLWPKHRTKARKEFLESKWIADWAMENQFVKYKSILKIGKWELSVTKKGFKLFLNFLESIQQTVLRGLIVSSGDLTQSLSTKALECLNGYLEDADEAAIELFATNFLACWRDDKKCLVAKPVLKVLDEFLGTSGCVKMAIVSVGTRATP